MAREAYLVIDQGGHATRAMIIDGAGRLLSEGRVGIGTRRPRRGWVEHDPVEILESARRSIERALHAAGGATIRSAGLATQRSTIVCWDRETGRPISRALSWQDTRNARLVESLSGRGRRVRRITGLPLSPHYGASKLRWCLDAIPEVRAALSRNRLAWGPLSSYLLQGLLVERPVVVDPANASRTLLWDLESRDWSDTLLRMFGLPRSPLPACVATERLFGHLRVGRRSIPLRLCTGDQSAVPFCLGSPDGRTVFVNMGTGAFIQKVVGSRPVRSRNLLSGILRAGRGGPQHVLEGTVNGAGAALDLYSRRLGVPVEPALDGYDPDAGAPVFMNGVSGLGSPFWRPRFPSRFLGGGGARQRMQAVIESILFMVRANVEELESESGAIGGMVVAGGLAASDPLCEALASLCGVAVNRPALLEATGAGAAYLLARRPARWSAGPTVVFPPRSPGGLGERYQRWREAMSHELRAGRGTEG